MKSEGRSQKVRLLEGQTDDRFGLGHWRRSKDGTSVLKLLSTTARSIAGPRARLKRISKDGSKDGKFSGESTIFVSLLSFGVRTFSP